MICEKCGKEHDGTYGSGRFCSKECARSYSTINEDKAKTKIAKCIDCGKEITINKRASIKNCRCSECARINATKKVFQYKHKNSDCKCVYCGKIFMPDLLPSGAKSMRTTCSDECLAKLRGKRMSELNEAYHFGGYRKGSGRGKKGWYKGIFCDSTWELAFVIYYLEHNLNIKRCTEKRKYIFNNKEYTYIPDFITDNGIIEIKGFKTEQWQAKIEQNPDVIVLYAKEMEKYLNYATEKYGNHIEMLYDDSGKYLKDMNRTHYWLHKNNKNTWIEASKLQEYLDNDYLFGQCKKKK